MLLKILKKSKSIFITSLDSITNHTLPGLVSTWRKGRFCVFRWILVAGEVVRTPKWSNYISWRRMCLVPIPVRQDEDPNKKSRRSQNLSPRPWKYLSDYLFIFLFSFIDSFFNCKQALVFVFRRETKQWCSCLEM